MSQIPAHVQAFDANGDPISIPLQGRSAVSGNRSNPLGDVNSILRGMQSRSQQSRNAAIAATERANAMLFPLRQDPRKTARINERRRAMNVTEQRGRTANQKKRDKAFRDSIREKNRLKQIAKERDEAVKNQAPPDEVFEEARVLEDMERLANENASVYENRLREDEIRANMIPDAATLRGLEANAAAAQIIDEYENRPATERFYDNAGNEIPAAQYDLLQAEEIAAAQAAQDRITQDIMARRQARLATEEAQAAGQANPEAMHPDHAAMMQAGQAAANDLYSIPSYMNPLGFVLGLQEGQQSVGDRGYADGNYANPVASGSANQANLEDRRQEMSQQLGENMFFPGPSGAGSAVRGVLQRVAGQGARNAPSPYFHRPPGPPVRVTQPPLRGYLPPVRPQSPNPLRQLPPGRGPYTGGQMNLPY